jgi:hypothetical protein
MGIHFTYVQDHGGALWHGPTHTHNACPHRCDEWTAYGGEGYGICDHTVAEEDACGCKALDVHLSLGHGCAVLKMLGIEAHPDYVGQRDALEVLRACGEHVGGPEHRAMEAIARLADHAHRNGMMVGWS